MGLRKAPICIAIALSSLTSVGQGSADAVKVKWSNDRTEKEHGKFQSVLNVSKDHVFVLVENEGAFRIQMFDQEMNMLKVIDATPAGKARYIWEDCLFEKDRMLVFNSTYEKKAKTLYATIYSIPDMVPTGQPHILLTGGATDKDDKYAFIIGHRPAGAGFHVYTRTTKDPGGPSKILLFDKDLQSLGEAPENSISSAIPFGKDEYEYEDSESMADGSRLIAVRRYPEKSEERRRKREGKPSYDMVFIYQDAGEAKGTVINIESEERFLQDLKLSADGSGIICAGLWGNKNSWQIRGAFFMRFDPTSRQVAHQNFSEFSDGLITQYMTGSELRGASRSERKGEDMEMAHYDLRQLVPRNDGSALLVAEQYRFDIIEHTNSNSVTRYVDTYLYRDILVVSIDPSGNIQWSTKIPKLQFSKDDDGRYGSYAMMMNGTNTYFLFNDNQKNLSLKDGEKIQQFNFGEDAVITVATVDPDGKISRKPLNMSDGDVILIPENCVQMNDDSGFLHGLRGRNYQFGTIQLP